MKTERPPLCAPAADFGDRVAVATESDETTYAELLTAARAWAARLLEGRGDLAGERVAFLVPPGPEYFAVLWGTWLAGGTAVPLCLTHPEAELEHVLADSDAGQLIVDSERAESLDVLARRMGIRLLETTLTLPPAEALPEISPDRPALLLYTSGTTSSPKGAVLSHAALESQVRTLVEAWAWTPDDRILGVLPLHHTHGIVNVCSCALWTGAACELLPRFDAARVWERFVESPLTLFMAVPTIYRRLIDYWESQPEKARRELTAACGRFRLMVSGSAALPVEAFEAWEKISGHRLLERYGMTEIGMALANPLDGERRPGTVGIPLPGVEVRVVDEEGRPVADPSDGGELQVRSHSLFSGYWGQPELTAAAFDKDWFRTGDVVEVDDGYFRILGRRSVDIIKSGGYKVSALEIEAVLREHPEVRDCSVAGVADPQWGECVCVAVVLADGSRLTLESLREWGARRLARYKLPHAWRPVEELPRNAMGKVVKPAVRRLFEGGSEGLADGADDDEAL